MKVASFWKNAATKVYKRIRSRQKGPLRNAEHATEDDLISDDPEVEALSLNLGGDMIGFLPKKAKEYADQRSAIRIMLTTASFGLEPASSMLLYMFFARTNRMM